MILQSSKLYENCVVPLDSFMLEVTQGYSFVFPVYFRANRMGFGKVFNNLTIQCQIEELFLITGGSVKKSKNRSEGISQFISLLLPCHCNIFTIDKGKVDSSDFLSAEV